MLSRVEPRIVPESVWRFPVVSSRLAACSAPGEPLQGARRLVDRGDDRVERGVDPGDDAPELAAVPVGVGPDREAAIHGAVGEEPHVGDERVHRRDRAVEALLERVEVAAVLLSPAMRAGRRHRG
jgi:hypothetical protein